MDARDSASRRNKDKTVPKRSRYEDAVQALDEALKIDPKDAAAWISKGIILINLGKNDAAIRGFGRVAEAGPERRRGLG